MSNARKYPFFPMEGSSMEIGYFLELHNDNLRMTEGRLRRQAEGWDIALHIIFLIFSLLSCIFSTSRSKFNKLKMFFIIYTKCGVNNTKYAILYRIPVQVVVHFSFLMFPSFLQNKQLIRNVKVNLLVSFLQVLASSRPYDVLFMSFGKQGFGESNCLPLIDNVAQVQMPDALSYMG